MSYTRESAESIALQALAWVIGNEDLRPVFLDSTGASAADLKAQAGDPHFLGAVLDFLMMDDAWVIGFCDTITLPYAQIMEVRAALSGGEQIHWT